MLRSSRRLLPALGLGAAASLVTLSAATSRPASTAAAAAVPKKLRIAMLQMRVGPAKEENLATAAAQIAEAAANGATVVVLPEMFNCPYSNASFPVYAEPVPEVGEDAGAGDAAASPSVAMLAKAAREGGVTLICGSIPETQHGKLFNTSLVLTPEGKVSAKFRKVHLFDIDIPGKITFRESDTLTGGGAESAPCVFEAAGVVWGLAICYDLRFAELAALAQQKGARVMVYPGAFNTTTGPLHWELLQKGRALDNQMFVVSCSPARSLSPEGYQAWGHSTAIDAWGQLVATTGHEPAIVYADLDFERQDEVRANVPILKQKRHDLYDAVKAK